MLFHTAGFLFLFFPLFLIAFHLAPKGAGRRFVIFVFSYLFYSGSYPFFIVLLLISSVVDYVIALAIHRSSTLLHRKLFLSVSIATNLGLLGFYKYGAMFSPLIAPTASSLGLPVPEDSFFKSFILPAGISFYTFQSMSYSIDVYRKHITPEKNFLGFCNYVAYLPQLIAGPIERFGSLYHQITDACLGKLTPQWRAGADRICLGIVQKLFIADSCGALIDVLLVYDGQYTFWSAWAIAIGFGLQIFYDFSAYTHMAIGISLMLGIRLSENFLAPYQARNVQDFWRRWHVTLSTWFRDYVYLPLGGSKHGAYRTILNLFLTFAISGLWHGAGWNFVLWGMLHGVYIVFFHLLQRRLPNTLLPHPLAVLITFITVHFAWILFRIEDLNVVTNIWCGMAGMQGFSRDIIGIVDLTFLFVITLCTQLVPHAAKRRPGSAGTIESVLLFIGAITALFISPEVVQFIYFQF